MPNIQTFGLPANVGITPSDRGIGTAQNAAVEQNRMSRESGSILGHAISQVGGQLGKQEDSEIFRRAQEAYQHDVHQQISAGSVNYSALYGNLSAGWSETAAKAPLNDTSIAAGFAEHTLGPSLDKFRASFDGAPEEVQKWADEQVARTRQHFTEKMIADSSTRAGLAIHENIGNIELEEFIVSAVDMEAIAKDRDHEAMKDSAWMWDEPVLTYQATTTDEELLVEGSSEEVDNLNQFKVLKFVAAETFANTPG